MGPVQRVLVASADPELRRDLSERLDWDDRDFDVAHSADEALLVLEGVRPEPTLLLLDLAGVERARVLDWVCAHPELEIGVVLLGELPLAVEPTAPVVQHIVKPAAYAFVYDQVERYCGPRA